MLENFRANLSTLTTSQKALAYWKKLQILERLPEDYE